jgi:hypothetical protein
MHEEARGILIHRTTNAANGHLGEKRIPIVGMLRIWAYLVVR